ncbi:SRPBCC family protein [Saccharothrix obliqua]|uniref:SRPBCC family protein n=1 Tax=Saccharothrix obliqua TaxID=2861747 RepID=UPI001C5CFAD2|nr:SRPBCC family protein [Saccharothrix obliqua]MBW4722045.1 SRPBCC domain-containing protein [Saccharothrix obliqua]
MKDIALLTVDGRSQLRIERRLAHPPEKVWSALTEPSHISKWYPFPVAELELKEGGKVSFDAGDGSTFEGVITEVDPPKVFAFREEEDLLRFEITPVDGGSRLVFSHTFDDRPAAASNASGWTDCLDALEQVVGGAEETAVDSDPVALHERLVKEFGLDQGEVKAGDDGWTVRYERQLREPADRVWAELTGGGEVAASGPVPAGFAHPGLSTGDVRSVEAAEHVEFDWLSDGVPAGTVRYEFRPGNGGARLTLVQRGENGSAALRDSELRAWRDHVEGLAAELLEARG